MAFGDSSGGSPVGAPGVYKLEFSGIEDETKSWDWSPWPHAQLSFNIVDVDKPIRWSIPCNDDLVKVVWQLTSGVETPGYWIGPDGVFPAALQALQDCRWSGLGFIGINDKGYANLKSLSAKVGGYEQRFLKFADGKSRNKETGLAHEFPREYDHKITQAITMLSEIVSGLFTGYNVMTTFPVAYKYAQQSDGSMGLNVSGPRKADPDKKIKGSKGSGLYNIVVALGVTAEEFNAAPFVVDTSPMPLLEEMFVKHAKAGALFSGTLGKKDPNDPTSLRQDWNSITGIDPRPWTDVYAARRVFAVSVTGPMPKASAGAPAAPNAELLKAIDTILSKMYGEPRKFVKDNALTADANMFGKNVIGVIAKALPDSGVKPGWPPQGRADPKAGGLVKNIWSPAGIDLFERVVVVMASESQENMLAMIGESEGTHAALVAYVKNFIDGAGSDNPDW